MENKTDRANDPSMNKFFDEMAKCKNIVFDYEVAKMTIECNENLISKMYYYDKDSKKNSI